jgi:hypothetical protein
MEGEVTVKKFPAALLVGGAAIGGVSACGSSAPSESGCKAAMASNMQKAAMASNMQKAANGNYGISEQSAASEGADPVTGQMPAQCKGFSEAQLGDWASDVLAQVAEQQS